MGENQELSTTSYIVNVATHSFNSHVFVCFIDASREDHCLWVARGERTEGEDRRDYWVGLQGGGHEIVWGGFCRRHRHAEAKRRKRLSPLSSSLPSNPSDFHLIHLVSHASNARQAVSTHARRGGFGRVAPLQQSLYSLHATLPQRPQVIHPVA